MSKKLILLIISLTIMLESFGQNNDLLFQFAHTHEDLFWSIVSRNYPFSEEEIIRYQEDIDFYQLSGNENIHWTTEFIKTYEPLLSKTYELQRNKGIHWNQNLILEFLDRDWLEWNELYFNRELTISRELFEEQKRKFTTTQFLIKETADSLTFYYEHEYFTKNRLFIDYRNKSQDYLPVTTENNEELKEYENFEISDIPISLLASYPKEINWYAITQFAEINWTWDNLALLFPHLIKRMIPKNKTIYEKLFEPNLNKTVLKNLAKEFSKKTRYFKIKQGNDKYGMSPKVEVIAPVHEYFIRDLYNFTEHLPDSIEEFKYKITHTPEGPKRFLDILFFENGYGFPGFACSEKTKVILELFDLPNHAFYPISISLNSQWYGKDTANYYLFVTDNTSLLNNLEYELTELRDINDLLNTIDESIADSLKLTNKKQFQKYISPQYNSKTYMFKELSKMALMNYFDLLTIKGTEIYFSKRLTKAFEEANISGLKYSKDYSINWMVEPPRNDSSAKITILEFPETNISYSQKTVKLYDEFYERMKVLESNHDYVLNHYKNIDRSKLDSLELKLLELEIKWNVIVPSEYRKYLVSNQNPKLGYQFRDYNFLPIERLELVGKEWYKHNPKLFRGLLIAENGLGDYLGLLMDANSNFKLSNTIYKFEHEMGKTVKSIEIE